jgi:predicted Rossmann fold nucleotide-binding protein DprA/Smf involved in DNA uptake
MPDMSDVAKRVQALLQDRLTEIDDETRQIERALKHLRRFATPEKTKPRRPLKARSRRRARRGAREDRFLNIIGAKPGTGAITIANEMGIRTPQVHTLASRLKKQGRITKAGSGYRPTA